MKHAKKCCIFCGKAITARAKEHVFPLWLLKHLGMRKHMMLAKFNKRTDKTPPGPNLDFSSYRMTIDRVHPLVSFLNGAVCKQCNCGWMSVLESNVQPIIVPLIAGTFALTDLGAGQRLTLARWAIKTAYALYFTTDKLRFVPQSHPRSLSDSSLSIPDRVAVFASQSTPDRDFDWVVSSDWIVSMPALVAPVVASDFLHHSYKISLQIHHLHLLVSYTPSDEFILNVWPKLHHLVYPPGVRMQPVEEDVPVWVPMQSQSGGSHRNFHYGLGLLYSSDWCEAS